MIKINFKRLLVLLGVLLVGFIIHLLGLGSTAGNFFWIHFGFLIIFLLVYGIAYLYITTNKKKANKLNKEIKKLKKDKKLKLEREKLEEQRKIYLANAKQFSDILDMGVARSLVIGLAIVIAISILCSLIFKMSFFIFYTGLTIIQSFFD